MMLKPQSKREAGVRAAVTAFEHDHDKTLKSLPAASHDVPEITETEYEINYCVRYFDDKGQCIGVVDYRYRVI